MPNIAAMLKQEIVRLARKELRSHTEGMRKALTRLRSETASMKRQVAKLEKKVLLMEEKTFQKLPSPRERTDSKPLRFTAKGLRSHRKRLKLSAENYARLAGVSAQSVYRWESGTMRPRKDQMAAVAALRGMSKREVKARLDHLDKKESGNAGKS